jgi:branched-chain amino acid transport system permease protein
MDLIETHRDELRFARRPLARALVALAVSGALLLPLLAPPAWVVRATLIALTAVGVIGQNLLIGYTGQVSFAQAGLLAIGAFSYGHLATAGAPFLVAAVLAGAIAAAAGLLVGAPSLRLKGPYLAIATLGFGIAVYQLFANAPRLSGGRMGLAVPPLRGPALLSRSVWLYYLTLSVLIVLAAAAYNLISSYVGRALQAVRDSEIAAEAMGVNLTRTKLLAFALSSFYSGVHGALYAQFLGHVEPELFNVGQILPQFVALVVGGLASIEGSIFGAAFVVLVPSLLGEARWAVPVFFGAAAIAVLVFEPLGLAGRFHKARLYFRHWPFR